MNKLISIITYAIIRAIYAKNKWPWFTKPYDLNLFCIRNECKESNKFDDLIGVAYMDKAGNERIFICPATTDPGSPYLQNPINAAGTAILAPGYYRKMFKLGKHKGYTALVQISPVTVIRDTNKNTTLDFNSPKRETGMYGINLHRAGENTIEMLVGKHSAGCQVPQVNEDNQYVLSLVRLQKRYIGTDEVSYAVIEQKELP